MGQPSKISKARIKRVSDAIRRGNTIVNSAVLGGISHQTHATWILRGAACKKMQEEGQTLSATERLYAEYLDEVNAAKADYEQKLISRIEEAGKLPQQWQASAWLLERKNPKDWGRKDKMDVEHSGSITIDMRLSFDNDDEEDEE